MLRPIFLILAVLGWLATPAVWGQTSVVKSLAELRKLGISVEQLRHETPGASVELGSLVEPDKAPGKYELTECVVLSSVVDIEQLVRADSGVLDEVTMTRRSGSDKQRSIFLVLGRDMPRAYLAFQFSVQEKETTKSVRYLFPANRIRSASE